MIFFTLLIGVSTALNAAPEVLQSALSNPTAFRDLFSEYQAAEGRDYVGGEQRLRASIFRSNIQAIAAHNAEEAGGWTQELNMFADMTEEEKASYTGYNVSASSNADADVLPQLAGNPSEKDWREDAVTSVKNQGNCGSCWIFSGIGALEGRYKIQGGSLTDFAEQEGLDCIKSDGCSGGIMSDVYDWVKKSGRVGFSKDIPYTSRQGSCNYSNKPNALTAFRVTGYTNAKGDDAHVTALATSGPLAVGFSVASDMFRYKGGIYNNRNCNGGGHAVVSVGYTSTYFRMKNSWGSRWGEDGFFRIARGNVCGITDIGFAPLLASTGARVSDDEDDSDKKVKWCKHEDSYLHYHVRGRYEYAVLRKAKKACLARWDCRGITREPYNDNLFTLRQGPTLYIGKSSNGETSWVVC